MRIPLASFSTEIVVRRSRFVATGWPIENPAVVRRKVLEVRESHPGCDHVVWAYLCGLAGETAGMSDDREPRGTAGRPVLDVLRGSGITNLLITVTRFFGGTKLGTGGLVKAYAQAAKRVVERIRVVEYVERRSFSLVLSYDTYETVKRVMEESDVVTTREDFQEQVLVQGNVPVSKQDHFTDLVKGATSGSATPHFT